MKEKIKKIAETLADFNVGLWNNKEYFNPFLEILKPANQLKKGILIWSIISLEMFDSAEIIRHRYPVECVDLISEYYKGVFKKIRKTFFLKKDLINEESFIKTIKLLHLRYYTILIQHEKDKPGPYFYLCKDVVESLTEEFNIEEGDKLKLHLLFSTSSGLMIKSVANFLKKLEKEALI